MAQFNYQAKTADGQAVSGVMEAESLIALRGLLRTKDMYLVTGDEAILSRRKEASSKKLPAKDLTIICKQLSSMLGAGVTLIRALDILYQQTEDAKVKSILRTIYEDVQKGDQFSDALKKRGNCFPHLMIAIVESGEASGTLEDVIGKLANQFAGDAKIGRKVISALVYPSVLLVLTICAVTAMLVFILPTFVGIFDDAGSEIPGLTKAIMNLSDFIVHRWYIIIGVLIVGSMLLNRFIATDYGRHVRDSLYLRLPIVKKVVVNVAAAGFARTMSNLVSSGLPLISGIDITAKVVNNAVMEERLMEMRDDIRTGMSLSYGVKKIAVFPPIVHSMIAIGEESGDLDNLLDKLSGYLDEEVEASIERLMSMMEPMLIVLMGACIGTIVVAMLLPIFGIYDVIQ